MGLARLSPALFWLLLLAGCAGDESRVPATSSELASISPDELGIIHPGSPEPGGQAPDFALRDLEKEVVKLSDFRGQSVVLNFFASWCVPCMAEMPLIQEAHLQAEAKGYVVLGIAVQDSRQAVRVLSESMGLAFPMVFDGDNSVGLAYEVIGPPATFFIDSTGKIISSFLGVMDHEELEHELKKLTG
jgi:peroxiredoxin